VVESEGWHAAMISMAHKRHSAVCLGDSLEEQINPEPLVKQLLLVLPLLPFRLLLQQHPLDPELQAAVSDAIQVFVFVVATGVTTFWFGTRRQHTVDLSVQAKVAAPADIHLG